MRSTLLLPSGLPLVADVEAGLELEAHMLLQRLAPRAEPLAAGATLEIELDWATLRIVGNEQLIKVEELAVTGEGAEQFTPSVTSTCRIAQRQRALLSRLGIAAGHLGASDFVTVPLAALDAPSVVGNRSVDEEPFTGWRVVSVTNPEDEVQGEFMVRELAARVPHWLVPLCLPPDWSFRIVGTTLIDVVSPVDETVPLDIDISP